MQRKILGSILAATLLSAGAMAAEMTRVAGPADAPGGPGGTTLSLTELCQHTRLSAADQTECKRRLDAATFEIMRKEVRRTYETKAGLRGGLSGSDVTSGAVARTTPQ
jgi:hypothetical protein